MRRFMGLAIIMILSGLGTFAGAQQNELNAEQQAMLETVRAALEAQQNWGSYHQFTVTTSRTAWTVTGRNTAVWETRNITAQIDAEIDPSMGLIEGELQWQTDISSSEESTPTSEMQIMSFTAAEGQVFAQMEGETASVELTDDLVEYQQTGLPALVAFPRLDHTIGLLDHTISITDQGVSRVNRRDQQTYRIELDFPESLPHLDFNVDEFIGQFNGLVELGVFTSTVMEHARLTLDVTLDVQTQQIVSTTLVLEIAIEMQDADVVRVAAGDGDFQLEYARQVDTEYNLLNE